LEKLLTGGGAAAKKSKLISFDKANVVFPKQKNENIKNEKKYFMPRYFLKTPTTVVSRYC